MEIQYAWPIRVVETLLGTLFGCAVVAMLIYGAINLWDYLRGKDQK